MADSPERKAFSYTNEFNDAVKREVDFLESQGYTVRSGILFGSLSNTSPRLSEQITIVEEGGINKEVKVLDSDADIVFFCDNIDEAMENFIKQSQNSYPTYFERAIFDAATLRSYRRDANKFDDNGFTIKPFSPHIPKATVFIVDEESFELAMCWIYIICSPDSDKDWSNVEERIGRIRKGSIMLQAVRHGVLIYGTEVPPEIERESEIALSIINDFHERHFNIKNKIS